MFHFISTVNLCLWSLW